MNRFLMYIPSLLYFLFRNIFGIKSKNTKDISNAVISFEQTSIRPGRTNFLICMNYIQQHEGKYILCREIDMENNTYNTKPIGIDHFQALANLMAIMRKVEVVEDISDDKYLYLIDYIVKNNHTYKGISGKVEVDFLANPENISVYLKLLDVAKLSYTNKLRNKINIIYKPYIWLK